MNKENLTILADYLESLPADYTDFSMHAFYFGTGSAEYMRGQRTFCGTAACAVGHGPAAGLTLNDEDWERLQSQLGYWTVYCKIIFDIEFDDVDGTWLFSGGWTDVDNTIHGAAARIRYFLDYEDVPEAFSEDHDDWSAFVDEYLPYQKGMRDVYANT